jgi:glyoxylase-like metal-dependent hydrolase (beta-lactamase superfamily II)
MIEEVSNQLFRIEVPLPQNPLKSVNSYLVMGAERHLMIDTGMNRNECWESLQASLRKLNVATQDIDIFVTHFHADHMGLVTHLTSDQSKVYYHQPEADLLARFEEDGFLESRILEYAGRAGFPEQETQQSLMKHPAFRYTPPYYPEFDLLQEGDVLAVGDYCFECIQTPGHTIGHMCLYERQHQILVSGDHILGDITPNISSWDETLNALGDYLESLDKVARLKVALVLPGHRRIFRDLQGRVAELKQHHEKRLQEVRSLVHASGKTAYEVASGMTWDFAAPWSQFPVMQKWFATGEAATHLKFLEDEGVVRRKRVGQRTLFLSR